MALRYNKKLVIIMIMLILLSCTSCGVKQSKDNKRGGLFLCKFYGYRICKIKISQYRRN